MDRYVLAVFLTAVTFLQLILAQTEILDDWEPPKEMITNYPYYLSGYDYEGAPVWIVEFGKWDLKSVVDAGGETVENFDKYVHQVFGRMINSTRDAPSSQGFFNIVDLDGYDMVQANSFPAVQKYLWMMRTFVDAIKGEKYKGSILVNVNNLFEDVWKVARPLLGQYLKNITLFDTNSEVWRPVLLQKIAQDQLPEKYGGFKSHKPVKIFG